jgi:Rieske Fe-S protein
MDDTSGIPVNVPATTRRNFIVWYLAGLLTATGVALIAPLLIFIWPPDTATKKGDLTVKLDKTLGSLKDGEAVSFQSPKETGFLMKDGGGDNFPGKITFAGYAVKNGANLTVFSTTCSHLGCSVAINPADQSLDCPCHGSRFHLDGTVLHGPATAPLSHLTWKQGASDSEILVYGVQLPGVG